MNRNLDQHIAEVFSDRSYRDDLKLFLGRNPDPFLASYDRQQQGGRLGVFSAACWPAFFAPIAWFMYRRMFLYAGLILAFGVLLGFILPEHGSSGAVGISMALAIMAKPAYLGFARRKIQKAGEKATDEVDRLTRIAKAGGVSYLGAAIGTLITLLPILLLFLAAQQP